MARPPAFPTGQVVQILILAALLVAVVVMKSRCGKAAEGMFKAFDAPAGTAARDGGADD
jgi:hypothetical protein